MNFRVPVILCLLTFLIACDNSEDTSQNNINDFLDPDYVYDPDDYYYLANPEDWENYDYAEFGIHLPEDASKMKAILVMVPGHNGSSFYIKNDSEWRAYANRNNFGLVGCRMIGDHNDRRYYLAGGGSGYALVSALENFADVTGIESLRTLPIVICGYSDGAIFSYTFACNVSYRVAAFVSVKGGYYPFIADQTLINTPGFFIYGENDLDSRNVEAIDAFNYYRAQNALWLLMKHENSGHELSNSYDLAVSYIEEVSKINIDTLDNSIVTLNEEEGYLTSQDERNYWTYDEYPYNKSRAGWLPNEVFAEEWKAFVQSFD